ncbi:MAG: phosphoribosylformylglycinamidine synthase I [Tepidisphaeraceae bacterium]
MKPKTLVLRTAGTNCDGETAHAFELAGATAERVHLNRILERPALLEEYQMMAFPGGFSYGDDIAAGRIFANQIVHHLRDAVRSFIDAGKPVIGVCNGFQVLIKTDLLPGELAGRSGQNCTLAHNTGGRFIDRWISLKAASNRCIWTSGLDPLELPIAHGEGRFVPADEAVQSALCEKEQVALVYSRPDGSPANGEEPHNPNGSIDDIAGICDASGLVLGLMPHPERFVTPLQHPNWGRLRAQSGSVEAENGQGAGLKLFLNAVSHVREAVGGGV